MRMDRQTWYESARESVDAIIDREFESLCPKGHKMLARIWQYLRDQEVIAIQSELKATSRLRMPSAASAFGGGD
jgi:hypothetical protein